MKHTYLVEVRGRTDEWGIVTNLTDDAANAMQSDGVTVTLLEHSIPAAVVAIGLGRMWMGLRDLYNFRWLSWRRSHE